MTDVHCHVRGGDAAVRELVIGEHFLGIHPWECLEPSSDPHREPSVLARLESLRAQLLAAPQIGVGEIGLDRLRAKEIPPLMREVFEAQLQLGIELQRPIVLHGAKCWGQVVAAIVCRASPRGLPPLLFHGFSRSDGLIPDIVKLGGFISVGPAVLNDHAVNYRELVKKIPESCLVLETDRTAESAAECPDLPRIAARVAELRGMTLSRLEGVTDENAIRFNGRIMI